MEFFPDIYSLGDNKSRAIGWELPSGGKLIKTRFPRGWVVNRFLGANLGKGLVGKSMEEFGSQGKKPSHPELLDWIAVKLMKNYKWKILKTFVRELVLSANLSTILDLQIPR